MNWKGTIGEVTEQSNCSFSDPHHVQSNQIELNRIELNGNELNGNETNWIGNETN